MSTRPDAPEPRRVELRNEHSGEDSRYLWAYVDDVGNLHIEGQDIGPSTAPVSDDGEYEYFKLVSVQDVPRLVALLGGNEGDDVLDVLLRYAGDRSHDFEQMLRESDIPVQLS